MFKILRLDPLARIDASHNAPGVLCVIDMGHIQFTSMDKCLGIAERYGPSRMLSRAGLCVRGGHDVTPSKKCGLGSLISPSSQNSAISTKPRRGLSFGYRR